MSFSSIPKNLRAHGQFIKALQTGQIVKLPRKQWALTHITLTVGEIHPITDAFLESLDFMLTHEETSNTSSGVTVETATGVIYKWSNKLGTEGFIGLQSPTGGRIELTSTHLHYLSEGTLRTYAVPLEYAKRIQATISSTCLKFKGSKACRETATGSAEAKYSTPYIIGIDETGRGSLAGPLLACATVWKNDDIHSNFKHAKDSKGVTTEEQTKLAVQLLPIPHAVGVVTVEELNTAAEGKPLNLNTANQLAFERALEQIDPEIRKQATILVDGTSVTVSAEVALMQPVINIPQGEVSSQTIAAASIIAKHTYDAHMIAQGVLHPNWSFERHKGYGNYLHLKLLKQHGTSPIHRMGFKPVRMRAAAAK
jgi:ribonuclease HII